MIVLKYPRRFALLLAVLATSSTTLAGPSEAVDRQDNLKIIQAALPDSASLQNKVVFVDFWASWCVPCRQSFPWMQSLHEKYGSQGFVVVAVNVDRDRRAAAKFLEELNPSFTVVFDTAGSVAAKYGLEAMPTSFLYGRDGKLVAQHQGFQQEEADHWDRAIGRLVRQEKKEKLK